MNGIVEWINGIFGIKKGGDIEEAKKRIAEATANAEPGTPEWTALRANMEQEQKIENMMKEQHKGFLGISGDKWLGAGLVITGLVLTLMWDTESPVAMKWTKFVMDMTRRS